MTIDQHRAAVALYRSLKRKPTPAEFMAYHRGRQAIGEHLTAGQRGFLEAARRNSGASSDPVVTVPAAIPADVRPPAAGQAAAPIMVADTGADDVPPWVLDDIPAEEAEA